MTTEKNKKKKSLEKEQFEILLEDIRERIKAIGEGYDVLNNKIDRLGSELNSRIDEKVGAAEERLTKRIDEVKDIVQGHSRKIEEHTERLTRLEQKVG